MYRSRLQCLTDRDEGALPWHDGTGGAETAKLPTGPDERVAVTMAESPRLRTGDRRRTLARTPAAVHHALAHPHSERPAYHKRFPTTGNWDLHRHQYQTGIAVPRTIPSLVSCGWWSPPRARGKPWTPAEYTTSPRPRTPGREKHARRWKSGDSGPTHLARRVHGPERKTGSSCC